MFTSHPFHKTPFKPIIVFTPSPTPQKTAVCPPSLPMRGFSTLSPNGQRTARSCLLKRSKSTAAVAWLSLANGGTKKRASQEPKDAEREKRPERLESDHWLAECKAEGLRQRNVDSRANKEAPLKAKHTCTQTDTHTGPLNPSQAEPHSCNRGGSTLWLRLMGRLWCARVDKLMVTSMLVHVNDSQVQKQSLKRMFCKITSGSWCQKCSSCMCPV